MTYLKTYDNFGHNIKDLSLYQKDDYILYYDEDDNDKRNGIIIDLFIRKSTLWYEVANVEGEKIGFHTSILEPDIERMLTPEEIHDIEVRNTSNKYNI